MTRVTVIDAKVLRRFMAANEWPMREDGDSYRFRCGRGSDYLVQANSKRSTMVLPT